MRKSWACTSAHTGVHPHTQVQSILMHKITWATGDVAKLVK